MLVQDGVNIEELPVLIRRATRNSYPFTSHSYTGEKIVAETEFDSTFRQVLQNCSSVNDDFRLLEVPSDKVRGYSAAFALQRLHILKHLNTERSMIHSFIRSAVMRELYDCYLAADGFSLSCLNTINIEVQIRLGGGNFSIEELLTLACVLKSGTEQIFKNSKSPSPSRMQAMSIVSENASRFLSNEDQEGERLEHFDKYCAKSDPQVLKEIKAHCHELSKNVWVHLFSRYKDISEETLPSTLQALPLSFKSMVSLLEKPLNKIWVQTNVIAMCVEYCRCNRYLSPVVMDVAANHFTNYGYSYEPLQLYAVLRAFGQLNYLPSEPTSFLKMVESCLWERFEHLNETHLLEILASFTFVNILPKNFANHVASDYYFDKVGKLKSPEKFIALTWLKGMKHAIIMDMTDDPQKCLTWLMSKNNKGSVTLYLGHTINLDINGVPLEVAKSDCGEVSNKEQIVKKLVLLLRSADHFLVNTKQLMGVQVQRLAHLKKLGYIPVEIRVSEILYADRISEKALLDVIKQHLSPHVNFDIMPEICEEPTSQVQSACLDQSLSGWLGYDDNLDHESDNAKDLDLIRALLKCKTDSGKADQNSKDPMQT
ncbi:hypothetical protein Btru_047338 [Bulinus truncatus]|nr:hypothetical protein Btru_047338 [Bulinus truncatus]